jgi:hypothetical protein
LVKNKRPHSSTSANPSSTESIEEIQRGRKDSYLDTFFLEGLSVDKLTRKNDYFNYTTGEVRKRLDKGECDDKERTPTVTREFKCLLVKEFILYNNQNIKIFNFSARGKDKYCGPHQLSRITSLELIGLINPCFFYTSRNVQL